MKTKQFIFTLTVGVSVIIMSDSLDSASKSFKNIFGVFLYSQVKNIEIC